MPKRPAIEPPDDSTDPNTPDTPDEETMPLEGSEPTASADASTSSASGKAASTEELPASEKMGMPATEESSANEGASTSSATGGTPPPPISGNRFFAWIRGIDIRREPGWIGGVCSGIAARLGIDPLIVRGIAVVIAVLGGPAILLYAIAWLLLPDANDKIHLEEVFRGRLEAPIAAIGALIVLSLLPVTEGFWYAGAGFWGEPHWGASAGRAIWTVLLLGALVWFVVWLARRGSTPVAAAATRPRDASAFVAGDTTTASPTVAFTTTPSSATPTTAYPPTSFAPAPTNATEPELAAWREQQAQVRAEQDAFRNQQARDKAAANRAAAEEAQRKRAAQREIYRAENARTRSHPLFSLIVIGLSIVAGGLATVSVANGDVSVTSVVVGLATMLAVLAIGIIINGIRGKRSGGAAGVAALVLPTLIIASTLSTVEIAVADTPQITYTPTESQNYTLDGGRVELDLTKVVLEEPGDFYNDVISLNIGVGDVTVIVPDDAHVLFNATVGAGSISTEGSFDSNRIGPMQTLYTEYTPGNQSLNTVPQMSVSVQMGAGNITVIEEGDNK